MSLIRITTSSDRGSWVCSCGIGEGGLQQRDGFSSRKMVIWFKGYMGCRFAGLQQKRRWVSDGLRDRRGLVRWQGQVDGERSVLMV